MANGSPKRQPNGRAAVKLADNRPEATALMKMQELANDSPQVSQLRALQQFANNSPQVSQLRSLQLFVNNSPQAKQASQFQALADATSPLPIQQKIANGIAQLAQVSEEQHELMQAKPQTAQRQPSATNGKPRPNNTGLPDNLKSGIEALSGMSLDHVKVHYNSAQPAQLNALAYAQGSDIHLAPGQEQHLPHEAWHIVQQAQGRVQPTMQMQDGLPVNDDAGLEREADLMGGRAVAAQLAVGTLGRFAMTSAGIRDNPLQMVPAGRRRQPQRDAALRQWGDISMGGRLRYPARQIPLHVLALGQRLQLEYRHAGGGNSGLRGGNYVYIATSRGRGTYVGITSDPSRRQLGHGDRFHLHVLNRSHPLTRIEVRGIEQFCINLGRSSTLNQNIAESISITHQYYSTAIRFGREFYAWVGREYGGRLTLEI